MSSKKTASSRKLKPKAKSDEKPPGYVFGRPTDYRPEYCELLVEHMTVGKSFESFAGKINSTFKTLYTWLKKHPDFLQAKEMGESKGLTLLEDMGLAGASGQKINYQFWQMIMKVRFAKAGWNPDKYQITFQDSDSGFEFEDDDDKDATDV